ncbi:MAG: hypothetical protein A2W99_13560 [Bacteroidetes bacterium GWF2_33_16]|nr:MAG: hypothetical protein A2X00_08215 [Bacteroidetes bacterium GWE2_32_14]OFY06702.1 MAG: hypothetical protein A2W99_13560 [Bacteroidetes bacterium GWF2_33_16]
MKNEFSDIDSLPYEPESNDLIANLNIIGKKIINKLKLAWEKWLKTLTKYVFVTGTVLFVIFWIIFYGIPVFQELALSLIPETHKEYITADSKFVDKYKDKTLKNILKLQRKLDSNTPNSAYLVINTTDNSFRLLSGKRLVRKGVCSTGSYTLLQSNDDKQWIFKTPRGVKRIHGKTTYPVWKKPDWAFIEEGLPVPPANDNSRFEYGTLGDYALSIGDGYLIHGTLYQRLLGLPVTHGCVRLNDEDLKAVYNTLSIGSKVFIY